MGKTLAICFVCLLPGAVCGIAGDYLGPWLIVAGACLTARLLRMDESGATS